MRLLLDENLPKKLKQEFKGHQIFTIREMGWAGKTNGILMQLMSMENFDALVTFDQNLQHQQNFKKYKLAVFVLVAPDNSYLTLKELVPKILETIEKVIFQALWKLFIKQEPDESILLET